MARKVAQMGFVTMLVLLVAAVALLPWAISLLVRSVAGFENASGPVEAPAPAHMSDAMDMRYVPDANTNYICRSPNGSGMPCPEGEFCDGTTQSCQKISAPSTEQVTGYFS
jgi:hypothetical protein